MSMSINYIKKQKQLAITNSTNSTCSFLLLYFFIIKFMDIDIPHLLEAILEDLGLSTRRAMTRHIRMGVLILNRQACQS